MRVGVLEINQQPGELPVRHVSKNRALRFVIRRIARWVIVGKLIQMLKDDDVIRRDIEHFRAQLDVIPEKRKFWKQNLLLSYPHKSQESWT